MSDYSKFTAQWDLSEDSYTSKVALLSHTGEDIDDFEGLKQGDPVAIRTAATQLQMEFKDSPLVTRPSSQSAASAGFLHEVLDMKGADGGDVDHITCGTARLDVDPQFYLNLAPIGEAKPLVITDFVFVTSQDAGDKIQLGQGVMLQLAGMAKPELSSISPAMWIAASARIMATLVDRGHLNRTNIKDYMAYTAKVGELAACYTWASMLLYDQEYRCLQAAACFHCGVDSQHLSAVLLKEKSATPGQTALPKQRTTTGQWLGPGDKEVCLQFNAGKCLHSGKCNFEHEHTVCLQAHPQCDHHTSQTTTKQD